MKTNYLLHVFKSIALGVFFMLFGCSRTDELANNPGSQDSATTVGKAAFAAGIEDSIKVVLDVVEPGEAQKKADTLQACVRVQEGTTIKKLNLMASLIDTITLSRWHQEAVSLHGTDPRQYLPALMIHYGLISGKQQMQMLFQPVCLHRQRINADIISDTLEPQYKGNTYAYSATSHSYISMSTGDFSSAFASTYTTAIKIAHVHDRRHTDSFTPGVDPTAVTYPFQEIFGIIYDNRADTLKVWNVADDIPQDGGLHLKHTLLLGPDIQTLRTLNVFQGKYGDLAHLCPPSCDKFVYQLK